MKKKHIIYLLLLLILPITLVHADEKEITKRNKFYKKVNMDIHINDEINGSIIALGNKIYNNSRTDGLNIFISNVLYTEEEDAEYVYPYNEYLIAIANKMDINTYIGKDGILIGNSITFNPVSTIARDSLIIANHVKISGYLRRNTVIIANTVEFEKAIVEKNIKVISKKISIDVESEFRGKILHSLGAKINNENENVTFKVLSGRKKQLLGYIKLFINVAIFMLLIVICYPKILNLTKNSKPIVSNLIDFFTGILTFLIPPIIFFLLLISSFGLLFSFILLFIYLIVLLIGLHLGIYALAKYLWKLTKFKENPYIISIIGSLIFTILFMFTPLVTILFVFFGSGILTNYFIKNRKI